MLRNIAELPDDEFVDRLIGLMSSHPHADWASLLRERVASLSPNAYRRFEDARNSLRNERHAETS